MSNTVFLVVGEFSRNEIAAMICCWCYFKSRKCDIRKLCRIFVRTPVADLRHFRAQDVFALRWSLHSRRVLKVPADGVDGEEQ